MQTIIAPHLVFRKSSYYPHIEAHKEYSSTMSTVGRFVPLQSRVRSRHFASLKVSEGPLLRTCAVILTVTCCASTYWQGGRQRSNKYSQIPMYVFRVSTFQLILLLCHYPVLGNYYISFLLPPIAPGSQVPSADWRISLIPRFRGRHTPIGRH